ncbi:MAG: TonB-dependent receptor domain-containing protein [Pyrinomonadaceae bacterium]
MFGRILSRSLAFTFAVLFFSMIVAAQDLDDVTITGKVTDSNGLVIVGAIVTATRVETGEVRSVVADDDGRYKILKLKPGTYTIKATAKGFGILETPEIETISAQNIQKDFKLSPADVKAEATVTVTEDDAPPVDTTRTIVGGTVTQREIEELPVDSRNPLDLVLTLGGTTEEQLSTRDLSDDRGARGLTAPGTTPEEAGIFGLSGGAGYSNNITIDGLDNNDDRGASFRFQPSIDAVQEVQVITNQFSAEYGRASGGRVNISTRGGSNRFRGRAYYYFRDESLNANTWNNNRRGIARAPFQDNDPGFTFGGPIFKNKLFFFTSYEYDNIFDTTLLDAWTPVSGGNPLFALPAPNNPAAGTVSLAASSCAPQVCPAIVIGNYLVPTDTPAKKHIFSTRIDWNVNNAHSLTFSWQLGRSNDLRSFSGTNRIADSIIGRVRNTDAYNLTHNWVISSNIINQLRVQYSKLDPSAAQAAGAASPAVLVTFTPPGLSSTTQVFGSTSNSSDRKENRWQVQDTLTWVAGPSTWRFGVDYQNVDTTFIDRFDVTGTYTFSNFSFFAGNSASRLQQNFNTSSNLLNKYLGIFVQNEWRVRPNITFSAGVRYERESVLGDNNNFGPRLAVAWNPFKSSSKTVIRFGAGIFYNRVLLRTIDDYTSDSQSRRLDTNSFNLPTGTVVTGSIWRNFLASQFPKGVTLDTIIPINATQSFSVKDLSRPTTVFRSLSPTLVIPESYQINAGFEREIAKGLVFETNVTYNKTVHLWRETNPNAPVLPAGVPDRNGDGRVTFTDYLLGITTGPNQFFNGAYGDGSPLIVNGSGAGTHVTNNDVTSANCTTTTVVCYVNVNTISSNSSTSCSTTTTTNTPVCRAFAAVNALRPSQYASLGPVQLEQVNPVGNSRYIGAVFELRKRYSKLGGGFGASWRIDYTLSRLMDDGIVNTSDPSSPGDFSKDWSRSLVDRTHRISLIASVDTPYWLGKLRFSPLFRWGSGAPFNLSSGGVDRNLDDVSNDRPNLAGPASVIDWRIYGSTFPTAVAQQVSLAPIGSPGTIGRNAGTGPQLWQFNLNVTREWKLTERIKLRPSLEVTNPLNMRVFSFGSNFINFDNLSLCSGGTSLTTSQQATCDGFLAPTRTATHRRMRLGFRIDF